MKNVRIRLYYLLCFIIPFAILASCYFLLGVYPSGHYTVLISDLNTQYIQFYSYLYNVFTGGKSLQYSFELGGGINFFGTFAYYLASPLSILILLFPKHIPDAILVITLLKVGFAGLTSSLYFTFLMGKRNNGMLLFSTAYSLMGFVIIYSFHVMWLDGMVWLPIILLAVERLVREQKVGMFIAALAASFMSNFYISFMIGLFTLMYFIIRLFSVYKIKEVKKNLRILESFLLGLGVSSGLAAWIIFPSYKALQNNPYNIQFIHFKWEWKLNLLNFYWRLLSGGYASSEFASTPSVYASIIVLLLFPMYFILKEIPKKERILTSILLLILFVSFGIPYLNLAWHGLKSPNAYPFRYAFVFSLLIIVMAVRVFQYMKKHYIIPLWSVYSFHILLIVLLLQRKQGTDAKILLINGAFLTTFALLLTIRVWMASLAKVTTIALVFMMMVDVSFNTYMTIHHLNKEMHYVTHKKYNINKNEEQAIQYVKEQNTQKYRVSSMFYRTLNDSLQYDYPALQNFNSMANGSFHRFLHKAGYAVTPDYIVSHNFGDTLLLDSILQIGYLVNDNSIQKFGFQQLQTFGYATVSKNNWVIPFGYPIKNIDNRISEERDPFLMQEMLAGKHRGDLFQPLENQVISYENLTPSSRKGIYERVQKNAPAYVTVKVDVPTDMQLYGYISGFQKWLTAEVNQKTVVSIPPTNERSITDMGFIPGPRAVLLKVKIDEDSFSLRGLSIVGLNIHHFEETVKNLQTNSMKVTNRNNTMIQGTIHLDTNSLYVFPIPYDAGWSITVDGKNMPIKQIAGGLLGTELDKGSHNVVLSYQSPGLRAGMTISIISTILFAGIILRQRRKRKA